MLHFHQDCHHNIQGCQEVDLGCHLCLRYGREESLHDEMDIHVDSVEVKVVYNWCSDNKGKKIYSDRFSGIESNWCLMYVGKTLLTSKGGTSSVMGEDVIPGGGIGAERSIMADGVFGPGGAHLGLFKTVVKSSVILAWKDDSFDIWGEDGFWGHMVIGG
jgi:hypothetical protein